MDTGRDITYRGFKLNDAATQDNIVAGTLPGGGISGSVVSQVDFSDLDVVQYREKRSEGDGMDVGRVFLGGRTIRMAGTLYAKTRAELFDQLLAMRAALNPVLAQRESPGDKGYLPIYFSMPTIDTVNFPTAVKTMRALALPRALQTVIQDEAQGGPDDSPLAIPWSATFIQRDPTLQMQDQIDILFTPGETEKSGTATAATDLVNITAHGLVAGDRVRFNTLTGGTGLNTTTDYFVLASGLTSGAFKVSLTNGGAAIDITVNYTALTATKTKTYSGNITNRGTYLGRLNMALAVGPRAGTVSFQVGDSVGQLIVPASVGQRIIRFKGEERDKVVTIEESGVELPRADVISFTGSYTWPAIPAGTTGWAVTFSGFGNYDATSHMWFWETFA